MKKLRLSNIFLICFFVSCTNSHLPDVDGMWQLKTIEDATGHVQTVDTIYYSFQRQRLFTYTQLNAGPMQFDPTLVVYGYVDFPAKDRMVIHIDASGAGYVSVLPWHSESVTYAILKLTSKEMILEDEGDIYRFINF
jgi:hypothetical protein